MEKIDGAAMRPPLGPLLANIFMSTLEDHLLPTLGDYLIHWKRNVDDTNPCINPNKWDIIIKALNAYHPKIQFTNKLEKEDKISFLDVFITRLHKIIKTTVFWKETNTNT